MWPTKHSQAIIDRQHRHLAERRHDSSVVGISGSAVMFLVVHEDKNWEQVAANAGVFIWKYSVESQ